MAEYEADKGTIQSEAEAREGGLSETELWLKKIAAAEEEEKPWRKAAQTAIKAYEAGETAEEGSAFNIFFANIETLVPALYNSTPTPDVRRRFSDADPVAKAVCDIEERAISYSVDQYDFDETMEAAVKAAALPGRGLARVRYLPHFEDREEPASEEVPGVRGQVSEDPSLNPGPSNLTPSTYQAISYEEVICEEVAWDTFVRGPARRWEEVPFVAFRHDLTKDAVRDLVTPELARRLEGDALKAAVEKRLERISFGAKPTAGESAEDKKKREAEGILATTCVYELWDKRSRSVMFLAKDDKDFPLRVEPDPLGLDGFFPVPRPLQLTAKISSLVPMCPHATYKKLLDQLDKAVARERVLTAALIVRGVVDAKFQPDFELLKEAGDNEFVTLSNATEMFQQGRPGSLEQAVLFWPLEAIYKALESVEARIETIKQRIYEVSGISDILRGATDADETLGAQQIKATWGSQRVQRQQARVARFARDLFRLKAEVIAKKFQWQTIKTMTGVEFKPEAVDPQALQAPQPGVEAMGANGGPPMQDAAIGNGQSAMGMPDPFAQQQAMAAAEQQAMMQAQQMEQAAEQLLRSDARGFRIDIESDSTIRADLVRAQQNISSFLAGSAQFAQAVAGLAQVIPGAAGPMVEVFGSFVRQYKLGKAAEDAIERMIEAAKQPQPAQGAAGPSPEQMAAEQAAAQAQQDHEQRIAAIEADRQSQEQAHAQAMAQHQADIDDRDQSHAQQMADHDRRLAEINIAVQGLKLQGQREKGSLDLRKLQLQRAMPPKGGAPAAAS
jgi:hypothetical protein